MPILVRNLKRCPQYSAIILLTRQLKTAIRHSSTNPSKDDRNEQTNVKVEREQQDYDTDSDLTQLFDGVDDLTTEIEQKSNSIAMTVVHTGLNMEEKAILESAAEQLNLKVFGDFPLLSKIDNNLTSQMILLTQDTDLAPRTLKYMLAKVQGVPVVKFSWLKDSISKECLQLPLQEEHLTQGDVICGKVHSKAINLFNERQLLFKGLIFSVASGCQNPSPTDLNRLIETGGGTVLVSKKTEHADFIIVPQRSKRAMQAIYTSNASTILTVAQFLECVSHGRRPTK